MVSTAVDVDMDTVGYMDMVVSVGCGDTWCAFWIVFLRIS